MFQSIVIIIIIIKNSLAHNYSTTVSKDMCILLISRLCRCMTLKLNTVFVNMYVVAVNPSLQILVRTDYIHHVVDDHDFKDDYLFFRFRQDGKGSPLFDVLTC